MRAVGIDFGARRIGVAISDSAGMVATPYETIKRVGDRPVEHGRIADIVAEIDADIVVVGLPLSLDGALGQSADAVLAEVRGLAKRLDVPVETHDERFSTVTAHQSMRTSGTKKHKKRDVVDQLAAAVFLQAWLDSQG